MPPEFPPQARTAPTWDPWSDPMAMASYFFQG
jgi:hypothetical protein